MEEDHLAAFLQEDLLYHEIIDKMGCMTVVPISTLLKKVYSIY